VDKNVLGVIIIVSVIVTSIATGLYCKNSNKEGSKTAKRVTFREVTIQSQHQKTAHFKKRLEDLTQLKEALEKYHKDYGNYPVSSGYDGLYTQYGKSGKEWIKGLSPNYIKSLPRDPRNTNNGSQQYLYKSNGKDYKLIAHGIEDCQSVKLKHLELIDLRRDCWAYGYWTEGAKTW